MFRKARMGCHNLAMSDIFFKWEIFFSIVEMNILEVTEG
jgi:hypothetical protein